MRKNEAIWNSRESRWKIKVQADGERKTFACAKRDDNCPKVKCSEKCKKGKIIAEKKADNWIEKRNISNNTRCDILINRFIDDLKLAAGTSHYINNEKYMRLYITPHIAAVKIGNLTQNHLQRIVDHAYANPAKGKQLSEKTLKNIRATVMAFMKYCRSENVTMFHPDTLKIPSAAKKRTKSILSKNDIITLFTVDTTTYKGIRIEDRFIHAYRFAIVTGLRPGELLGLKRSDIRGNKLSVSQSINVYKEVTSGKNKNASRTYTLDSHALKILSDQQNMLAKLGEISPFVFPSENLANATWKQLYDAWKKYCRVNGIDTATTLYELRHTFVSVNTKMPIALKRLVMGHSENMDTQGIYGHEKEDDMDDAASYIDDAFKQILGW